MNFFLSQAKVLISLLDGFFWIACNVFREKGHAHLDKHHHAGRPPTHACRHNNHHTAEAHPNLHPNCHPPTPDPDEIHSSPDKRLPLSSILPPPQSPNVYFSQISACQPFCGCVSDANVPKMKTENLPCIGGIQKVPQTLDYTMHFRILTTLGKASFRAEP